MTVITRFPSSNSVGTTGWTNPTNAYADDGVYATCMPAKSATVSSYFSGFDFSAIGDADTLNSVTLYCKYHVDTQASIADIALRTYDNTTQIGTDLTNNTEPLTDTVYSLVIPPTLAQLKSSTFRIRASGHRGNNANAVTLSLDCIYVVVDYTPGSNDVSGSLSQTLESATLSASGRVEVKGAVFANLQDASIVATGHVQADSITASLSQTLESVALSAVGKATVKGGLTAYLDSCSVVATGKVTVRGTASKALDSCGVSASGKVAVKGIVSQTLENVTLIATSGATFQPIAASVNVTLDNVGIVASGKIPVKAGVVIALESAGGNAAGKVKVTGGLSKTLSDVLAIITANAITARRNPTKLLIANPCEDEITIMAKHQIRVKARNKIHTIGRGD